MVTVSFELWQAGTTSGGHISLAFSHVKPINEILFYDIQQMLQNRSLLFHVMFLFMIDKWKHISIQFKTVLRICFWVFRK